MPTEPAAASPVVDLSEGADAVGTLRIEVLNPRTRPHFDLDPPSEDTAVTVMPLLAVNGSAIPWERPAVTVNIPAGANLIEVMDDHAYESRTVEVRAGAESELFVGIDADVGTTRVRIGSRQYAAAVGPARFVPGWKAFGAACLVTVALIAAAPGVAALLAPDSTVLHSVSAYGAMAIGVASFFPFQHWFRKRSNEGPEQAQEAPPIETMPFTGGRQGRLVPAGTPPPPDESGLHLRLAPDETAMLQLTVRIPFPYTAPRLVKCNSNSFEDWLAAPEVTVNDQALPPRWGDWWVPLDPGPCTVQVRLPGFADPRRPDAAPTGPEAEQTIELEIAPHQTQLIDCRYNIVRLASERLARHPDTESEWQHVLRTAGRLEEAEQVASAPPLKLTVDRY